MTLVDKAILRLKEGPTALEQLELLLRSMTLVEHKQLIRAVLDSEIPAPMIVHFDYRLQAWYRDL